MRTEAAASEWDVIAEPELAGLESDHPLQELGGACVDLDRIEVTPDREKLGRAAVERRLEHLQRGDDLRFLAIGGVFDRVHDRVPGDWRMVAHVLRQIAEQDLHPRLVVIEPDHFLSYLRAVCSDGVAEALVAQLEIRLEIPLIERTGR